MTVLHRLVAAAALVSAVLVSSVEGSAADHYNVAHRRHAAHGHDMNAVRAPAVFERDSSSSSVKRCPAKSATTTTKHTTSTHHSTTAHPTTTKKADPPASNDSGAGKPNLSGKKSLAWSGSGDILSHFTNNINVIYTWGATCPSQATDLGLDCGSMLWGYKNLAAFEAARSSHKVLLGPNEFNLASQSNMSPGEVASLWNQYIKPYGNGRILVSPSVASTDNALEVMQEVNKECGGDCGWDAVSVHFYGNTVEGLISYVTKMYEGLGYKPIWLTEFNCANYSGKGDPTCSSSEVWAFIQGVVEWAEKTEWVQMYSAYGWSESLAWTEFGLMTSDGYPNSLGSWYLNNF